MCYALSLEEIGDAEAAEIEFKAMKGRYSYFEPRYQYGLFLVRQGRDNDAYAIFSEMLDEERHLGSMEKKANRVWLAKTRDELKKLPVG